MRALPAAAELNIVASKTVILHPPVVLNIAIEVSAQTFQTVPEPCVGYYINSTSLIKSHLNKKKKMTRLQNCQEMHLPYQTVSVVMSMQILTRKVKIPKTSHDIRNMKLPSNPLNVSLNTH